MKFISVTSLLASIYCFYQVYDRGIDMSNMEFWNYFLAGELLLAVTILCFAFMLIRFGTKKAVRFVKRIK